MESILGKIALGWLRHAIMGIGVWLVHSGYISSDQSSELTGALMVAIPILFSALDKWEAQQAKNKAVLQAAAERRLSDLKTN